MSGYRQAAERDTLAEAIPAEPVQGSRAERGRSEIAAALVVAARTTLFTLVLTGLGRPAPGPAG